jgi:hypothetical protein
MKPGMKGATRMDGFNRQDAKDAKTFKPQMNTDGETPENILHKREQGSETAFAALLTSFASVEFPYQGICISSVFICVHLWLKILPPP